VRRHLRERARLASSPPPPLLLLLLLLLQAALLLPPLRLLLEPPNAPLSATLQMYARRSLEPETMCFPSGPSRERT
jgi:hypothetical protein